MQFAILAQSPREMSQTARIHPRYFLLRVRVSIRPRYFVNAKKPNTTVAARSPTGQRHRPSERRNNLNGSLYLHARWRLTSQSRCNDSAKRGSVCEAFEKKPLPLALTLLLRYRYRPIPAQGYALLAYKLRVTTLECLINVPVRVFISRKMPPYTGLIWHYTFIKKKIFFFFFLHLNVLVCTYWPHNFLETQRIHPI